MNESPKKSDEFTQGSFGMRRMTPWQVRALAIVSVIIVALLVGYSLT